MPSTSPATETNVARSSDRARAATGGSQRERAEARSDGREPDAVAEAAPPGAEPGFHVAPESLSGRARRWEEVGDFAADHLRG